MNLYRVLTLNVQLKTNVAEGERFFVCSEFTNAADVVIVQINVHKLLLSVHSAPAKKQRGRVRPLQES